MADELVDIVDEAGAPRGTAMKSHAHAEGLWHYSIHCWVVRGADGGSVLFQRRAPDKELFPDLLDITAAGHYQAGESVAAGVREIVEELGVNVPFEQLVPLGIKLDVGRFGSIVNREFCHVFLLRDDRAAREYRPGEAEVSGLGEISIDDGLALFGGAQKRARCRGIRYDRGTRRWVDFDDTVSIADFIPRLDPYYLKVFIMAQRLLAGERPLAI